MQQLFASLRGNQAETDRFMGVIAGATSIPEFFAPETLRRIIAAAKTPATAWRVQRFVGGTLACRYAANPVLAGFVALEQSRVRAEIQLFESTLQPGTVETNEVPTIAVDHREARLVRPQIQGFLADLA
jgi:hypothetical protein